MGASSAAVRRRNRRTQNYYATPLARDICRFPRNMLAFSRVHALFWHACNHLPAPLSRFCRWRTVACLALAPAPLAQPPSPLHSRFACCRTAAVSSAGALCGRAHRRLPPQSQALLVTARSATSASPLLRYGRSLTTGRLSVRWHRPQHAQHTHALAYTQRRARWGYKPQRAPLLPFKQTSQQRHAFPATFATHASSSF